MFAVLDVEGKPQKGKPTQSGRDYKRNPNGSLRSEVRFKPGSIEVKGKERNR